MSGRRRLDVARLVVASLIAVLLPASPARALDLREWVPGLVVTPFLSEQVEYESNVFQVPSGAQGDVVFKTIPGFVADLNFGPHSLSAGYRAEFLNFVTLTSQNTTNQFAVAQLLLQFNKLSLKVRDDYAHTTDPPGTELTGRIRSDTNIAAAEAEYGLTQRFSVGSNFSWTYVNFQQSVEELDRNEYLGGASVFWHFLPKTDLRLSYSYTEKDFTVDTDRNVSLHTIALGLRGDLTAKLSSTFRLGFLDRVPHASGGKGYTGLIGGGDWIYRPTEQTTITVTTDRSVQESTFENVPYYVSTSGFVRVQHRLFGRLTVGIQGGGGVNDYPLKETVNGETKWRNDTFYAYGGGVDYEIRRWLSVGVEYRHTNRRSNFDIYSFADDKITGKLTMQF